MRLLIIDCSAGVLAPAIAEAAGKLRPKPEAISTMSVCLERLQLPEAKRMMQHLYMDHLIVIPPASIEHPAATEHSNLFNNLLREVTRQVSITSGKICLVSSVEVIGDATQRTEAAIGMAYSDIGILLESAEGLIRITTDRHFILRFPYFTTNMLIGDWIGKANPSLQSVAWARRDIKFGLCHVEDVVKIIVEQLQTGWFGTFNVTPNDYLQLSKLMNVQEGGRPEDMTLMSRYSWQMTPSQKLWDKLMKEHYGVPST